MDLHTYRIPGCILKYNLTYATIFINVIVIVDNNLIKWIVPFTIDEPMKKDQVTQQWISEVWIEQKTKQKYF